MNCKQGDLAYITKQPYLGHLVEVLELAPFGNHMLPDGYPAYTDSTGCWVCKSLQSPFDARIRVDGSVTRKAMFASIDDRFLRPIRLSEEPDETLSWCDVPSEVTT